MKMKLTPEELEALPRVRQKWLDIGLRTRTDKPLELAWEGVKEAYRIAGRSEPKIHIWMDSPLRSLLACACLAQVRDQVRAQVRDQVRAQVRDQVRAKVRDQVSDQVMDYWRSWRWWMPGQLESSYWLSFYDALRDECSFEKLNGLIKVAENCALCWMFPDVVVFCASPTEIHRDEQGRLHNLKGAAISFADGWGVYAVHGVRV